MLFFVIVASPAAASAGASADAVLAVAASAMALGVVLVLVQLALVLFLAWRFGERDAGELSRAVAPASAGALRLRRPARALKRSPRCAQA